MRRLVLCLLLLSGSGAVAQGLSAPAGASDSLSRSNLTRSSDLETKAAKARADQDRLYRRGEQTAKRAIGSMCVECLGARYNRPGPKTPLILSDELSDMTGEPELEGQP